MENRQSRVTKAEPLNQVIPRFIYMRMSSQSWAKRTNTREIKITINHSHKLEYTKNKHNTYAQKGLMNTINMIYANFKLEFYFSGP